MEKYSAFRDKGTGIQPFSTPIIPQEQNILAKSLKPLMWAFGLTRTTLFLVLLLVHFVLSDIVCAPLALVPSLHELLNSSLRRAFSRLLLYVAGFLWISPDYVSRKRGKLLAKIVEWQPKPGDIIISNWVSWIEVVWLTFRFDPIFVFPIIIADNFSHESQGEAGSKCTSITGFTSMSLANVIRATGYTPPYNGLTDGANIIRDLSSVRRHTKRPLVIFPECTTSNGRGLLRFVDLGSIEEFHGSNIFVMGVRVEPPTAYADTSSLSIPRLGALNPLAHIFNLCACLTPRNITIRLLDPSESPGAASFTSSDLLQQHNVDDVLLSNSLSVIISSLTKLKRTGLGFEEKTVFLRLFNKKL